MTTDRLRSARALVILLAIGHMVNDFYALMLSWLLPEFRDRFLLSIAQVTWIVAVSGIFNSMSQPVFGYVSERTGGQRWYIIFGTLLAGVMSLMGLAPNIEVFVAIVLAGSIGVGLFHPTGAAAVFEIVGPRDKLSRSLFAVAGGVGMAGGPILITRIVDAGGLSATWLVFPPAVLVPLLLAWLLMPSSEPARGKGAGRVVGRHPDRLLVVVVLFIAVVLRSTAAAGANSFVALRCDELEYTRQARGYLLSLMALFGSVGGMVGGYLAGRIGSKPIMLCSSFLSAPLLYGYVETESWFLLSASTFLMSLAMPHFVMTAQNLMPESAGTVAGIMMGMAWSVAGLVLPIFGKISDVENVGFAIKMLAILPIPAGILILFLRGSALDATS